DPDPLGAGRRDRPVHPAGGVRVHARGRVRHRGHRRDPGRRGAVRRRRPARRPPRRPPWMVAHHRLHGVALARVDGAAVPVEIEAGLRIPPPTLERALSRRPTSRLAALLLLLPLGTAVPTAAQVRAGDAAWEAGDFAAARAAYSRALAADPASVRSLYRLGLLASWDDRLDSALVLLRR